MTGRASARRDQRAEETTPMTLRARLARLAAIALAALFLPNAASALDYPTRPVKWVVGYPPGGTTDVLARIMGDYLSKRLGQNFIIENRPGAGNNIGTE